MLNRRSVGRPADRSVFVEVAREAENHPTRLALIGRDGRVTYAELVDQAWRDAVKLAELGIASGTEVAILCENRPDWLRSYLALSAADAHTLTIGEDDDAHEALDGGMPRALIGSTAALSRLSPILRDELRTAGTLLLDFDREMAAFD